MTKVLDQDVISGLIARPRGEDPVVTLYLKSWGGLAERKAGLKNLLREGDGAIEEDTGWDAERKKLARGLLESLRQRADTLLQNAPSKGRGSHALFAGVGWEQTLTVPVDIRDRVVVDRSPYASPLSSLIDQYERYGVILCDAKKARLFGVYLAELDGWEEIENDHEKSRSAPAGGPARRGGSGKLGGGYHGLEALRRKNHAEYVLHLHLSDVADQAFRRFKLRPYDRLILGGPSKILPQLEEHLHSYLKQRIVAREQLPVDLSRHAALQKVLPIEARVEEEKERSLLAEIADRLGGSGLATAGLDETLRCLFFGKVRTLVVLDEDVRPGRECPECHFLFLRPEDEREKTPTLVECPVCKRSTRRIPDVVDEAVELAILSGASVEHVAFAKDELRRLGGMAAVLRFK